MITKKYHYFKFFSLALLIFIFITKTVAWAEETYKIGGIFSLTGPASFVGQEHLDGVKIAIDKINADGGIDGKKLEIVIKDTGGDQTKTVLLIEELSLRDRVIAIIGPSLTHTSDAALSIARKNKTPLISLSGMVQVNKPLNPWAFRTGKSNELFAAVISDYMNKQHIQRVGLIFSDTANGRSFKKEFKRLASDRGIKNVETIGIHPRDRDLCVSLLKISKRKPDAILAWVLFDQLPNIIETKKLLELKKPLYLGNMLSMRHLIKVVTEFQENIIVTSEKVAIVEQLSEDDLQKSLIKNYIVRSKEMGMDFIPELGGPAYDAVALLAKAIKNSHGDKERIRDSLEQIKGFIGVGGVYSFSSKSHSGLGIESLSLVQIRDGKPYLVYSAKGCQPGTIMCPDNICREMCD
jgi:branched-chain amino acid transport system substrate-binding protein